jgi:hypothetical protein
MRHDTLQGRIPLRGRTLTTSKPPEGAGASVPGRACKPLARSPWQRSAQGDQPAAHARCRRLCNPGEAIWRPLHGCPSSSRCHRRRPAQAGPDAAPYEEQARARQPSDSRMERHHPCRRRGRGRVSLERRAVPIPLGHRTCRCAIYTRKSTEEGLEQEFNSLDAQREACEAYIRSQVHEGWTPSSRQLRRWRHLRRHDGPALPCSGFSPTSKQQDRRRGGLQGRPADPLAADFARIVEIFDAHGVSFVSVTQQFNTTTSMGRLTLNVLLSFAQFEREVTAERIRDKIAASKRKGMWMGGNGAARLRIRRRGVEMKFVVAGGSTPSAAPDPKLLSLIANAHRWFSELQSGRKVGARSRKKRRHPLGRYQPRTAAGVPRTRYRRSHPDGLSARRSHRHAAAPAAKPADILGAPAAASRFPVGQRSATSPKVLDTETGRSRPAGCLRVSRQFAVSRPMHRCRYPKNVAAAGRFSLLPRALSCDGRLGGGAKDNRNE